ncbi:HAD-IIIA family hydrolase [Albibacterium sp.]|uniref:KdsC family phosphatase n=1 Tax=Albibacterium sp. TaxID=2952885 RepID=UPI002D1D6AFB|nr:HAD-IIIA family hydrolase [Albibacterium sp.]HUH18683.1 HAD-IIIA family hydrolase [Albibacterium sp.]
MILFDQLKRVKAFVFDIDGVLTNGEVLVTEEGEQLRSFYIKDGYALQLAVKQGYPIAVITGGKSLGVKFRLEGLGIKDVFIDISNKTLVLEQWMKQNNIQAEDILYMGDDIPDIHAMEMVGLASCPADAVEDIKAISHYISSKKGGKGAVRDIIEKVLRLQDKWNLDSKVKSI